MLIARIVRNPPSQRTRFARNSWVVIALAVVLNGAAASAAGTSGHEEPLDEGVPRPLGHETQFNTVVPQDSVARRNSMLATRAAMASDGGRQLIALQALDLLASAAEKQQDAEDSRVLQRILVLLEVRERSTEPDDGQAEASADSGLGELSTLIGTDLSDDGYIALLEVYENAHCRFGPRVPDASAVQDQLASARSNAEKSSILESTARATNAAIESYVRSCRRSGGSSGRALSVDACERVRALHAAMNAEVSQAQGSLGFGTMVPLIAVECTRQLELALRGCN